MDFLKANYQTMTLAAIARHLDRSYAQVDGQLYRLGLYKNRRTVKRRNLTAFSELSETQWAYMAGLIDGEGTVTIIRKGHHSQVSIQVANTSYALHQVLKAWGFWPTVATNTNGKKYWRMTFGGYGCLDVLERLRPHLVVKAKHADLLMEFIRLRLAQRFRDTRSERMEAIWAELRALNRRGSRFDDEMARYNASTTSPPQLTTT